MVVFSTSYLVQSCFFFFRGAFRLSMYGAVYFVQASRTIKLRKQKRFLFQDDPVFDVERRLEDKCLLIRCYAV